MAIIRQATEIDDLTKDQRTVFVSQLVMKATEKQIRKFFEKIGKVKDVIMIRDKYTNRHKGYASGGRVEDGLRVRIAATLLLRRG